MRLIDADALTDWIIRELRSTPNGVFDALNGRQAANLIGRAIDEQPIIGGWISVKNRLPKTGGLALVYGSAGAMTVARYIAGNDWVVPGLFSTITHWMPLPEPPKEEKV